LGRNGVSEVSDKLRDERFVTLLGPRRHWQDGHCMGVAAPLPRSLAGKSILLTWKALPIRAMCGGCRDIPGTCTQIERSAWSWSTSFVREKLLIILDSCEHVIETSRCLPELLYQETEQVYLLAPSREL